MARRGRFRGLLLLCLLLPGWLHAGEEPEAVALVLAPPPVTAAPPAEPVPLALSLSAEPQPHPEATGALTAYSAKYEVRYSGLKVGEMTQSLSAGVDGRHSLQTIAYTTGMVSWVKSDRITERSTWLEEDGVLLPLSYTYRYSGRSKDVFERLDFDWLAGQLTSLRDGKTTELAVARGTLDKHMYQVVLRQDLRQGLTQVDYPVADRGKVKQYSFEVLGEEAVKTRDFGTLNCLKVKKGTTLIWVAEKFDYLPVKIEKDEDGTSVGSYLIEFQGG